MQATDRKRIAVLIDAENTSSKYIDLILSEIDPYGAVTYMRIYGNSNALLGWKDAALDHAMTPIMQFNYTSGKNASDSALIIDAMDILYTGIAEGFCLITSDSDFTKLAIRLREAGKFVIGMGKMQTPKSLVNACEEFKYLDMLYNAEEETIGETEPPVKETHTEEHTDAENPLPSIDKLKDEISRILSAVFQGREWVRLGDLGNTLPKYIPGFNVKLYGCSKLKKLMEKLSDRFEMREISIENSVPDIYVRDKQ